VSINPTLFFKAVTTKVKIKGNKKKQCESKFKSTKREKWKNGKEKKSTHSALKT
jgi:hypothetical protein